MDGDFVHVHIHSVSACLTQLFQGRRHSSFRDVVQSPYSVHFRRRPCLHADSYQANETLPQRDVLHRDSAIQQLSSHLLRQNRSSFDADVLRQRNCVTLPTSIPLNTGRVTASVISMCPPQSEIPVWLQAALRPSTVDRTSSYVDSGGKSAVTNIHLGTAPVVAISLALTSTGYRAAASARNVMGSDFSTRSSSASVPSLDG